MLLAEERERERGGHVKNDVSKGSARNGSRSDRLLTDELLILSHSKVDRRPYAIIFYTCALCHPHYHSTDGATLGP